METHRSSQSVRQPFKKTGKLTIALNKSTLLRVNFDVFGFLAPKLL
jgi:hypothetical protein